jgi:peptidoglycan/LPS O-acetylase OafA/YrhL
MKQRIDQLDSLRGLAAITVVVGHFTNLFPAKFDGSSVWWTAVLHSPLICVMAGHQAVIFFFVLSGFVLALPFYRGPVAYGPWIAKRFCRICLPYYAAMLLAVLLVAYGGSARIPTLSQWFNDSFQGPISVAVVLNHLLLIGDFANYQLNPVVWSLVMEMRLSLVFPLVIALFGRGTWWKGIFAAYAVAGVGYIALKIAIPWQRDYALTFQYVPVFVVGCMLARHAHELSSWFGGLRRSTKYGAIAAAILLYTYPFWFIPDTHIAHLRPIDDFFTVLAVAVFIVSALGSSAASSLLRWRPAVAIGKASYSLYLLHCICLLAAVHLLFGRMPIGWILVVAVMATFPATAISYWIVEVPSMALGRRLAAWLAAAPAVPQGQPAGSLFHQDGPR